MQVIRGEQRQAYILTLPFSPLLRPPPRERSAALPTSPQHLPRFPPGASPPDPIRLRPPPPASRLDRSGRPRSRASISRPPDSQVRRGAVVRRVARARILFWPLACRLARSFCFLFCSLFSSCFCGPRLDWCRPAFSSDSASAELNRRVCRSMPRSVISIPIVFALFVALSVAGISSSGRSQR